ncbi:6834_t:CDS:2, partial [Ambispora leptoticha]
ELTEFVKKYSAAGQFASGLEALSSGTLVDYDDKNTKPIIENKKNDRAMVANKSVVDSPKAKLKSYVETHEERAAKEAEVNRGMIGKFFGSLLALFGVRKH